MSSCNPLAVTPEPAPPATVFTAEGVGTDVLDPEVNPLPGGFSNFEADCAIAFLWLFDGSVLCNGSRVFGSNF